MKVSIKRSQLNNMIKEEMNGLIYESIQKRDYKALRELYKLETGESRIDETKFASWIKTKNNKQLQNEIFGFGKKKKEPTSQPTVGLDQSTGKPPSQPNPDNEPGATVKTKPGVGKKVSNFFAGIKDIGLGSGTTILGGEETIDMEKRKEKLGAAKAKVEGWLTKLPEQNPLVGEIKALYQELETQKFPNAKKYQDFQAQLGKVKAIYDKIVASFEQSGKTEQDAQGANVLISVLRGLIIYYQDYKIADSYVYTKRGFSLGLLEQEAAGDEKIGAGEGEESASRKAALSKKLPAGLAITGASLLGLGFVAGSQGFKDALLAMRDMSASQDPKMIADGLAKHVVNQVDVKGGKGITQAINMMHGFKEGDPGFLGPNAPISELAKYKEDLETLKQALQDKAGGTPIIDKIINGEIPGKTKLGAFFKDNISGKGGSLLAINPGTFKRVVTKQIYKQVAGVAAQPLATVKNQIIGSLTGMGEATLTALGIGFLGSAVASAGLRAKGAVDSRMTDMYKFVKAMPDVKAGGGTKPVPVPATPETNPDNQPGATVKTPEPGQPPKPGTEPGPTIVDPSMQPTIVDPTKPGKTAVEPSELPTVTEPDLSPDEFEEETPERPDIAGYKVDLNDITGKNIKGGMVTAAQAEEILLMLGVKKEDVDTYFANAEVKASAPMKQGELKEGLLTKRKLYSLNEVRRYANDYAAFRRMQKLAGITKD